MNYQIHTFHCDEKSEIPHVQYMIVIITTESFQCIQEFHRQHTCTVNKTMTSIGILETGVDSKFYDVLYELGRGMFG